MEKLCKIAAFFSRFKKITPQNILSLLAFSLLKGVLEKFLNNKN